MRADSRMADEMNELSINCYFLTVCGKSSKENNTTSMFQLPDWIIIRSRATLREDLRQIEYLPTPDYPLQLPRFLTL